MSRHQGSRHTYRWSIPRFPYVFLSFWLKAIRVRLNNEILRDLKFDFRRKYKSLKKKRENSLNECGSGMNDFEKRNALERWFMIQIIGTVGQETWMKIGVFVTFIRFFMLGN